MVNGLQPPKAGRHGRMEERLNLRFSILGLMALVMLISVGLAAALAGAFTFAAVTLSATTLGALRGRGPARAFFLGCSVFGWAFMLLAFEFGPEFRNALPTTRPIIRVYEVIHGPAPTTFKSPDEVSRWVIETTLSVNRAITVVHSLIALAFALAGGTVIGLIANGRQNRAARVGGRSLRT